MRLSIRLGWVLTLVWVWPSISSAQQIAIGGFPVPTFGSYPAGITPGPNASMWFTESQADKIGSITPAGAYTEYAIPTSGAAPGGIAAGPNSTLWFTESGANQIGTMTTAGAFTEYPVPTPGSYPDFITLGPGGTLWFTEYIGNKIGRITATGTITEFVVPTSASSPVGITEGPDAAIWFTESTGNKIGRLTTAGVFSEYPLPHSLSSPDGIVTGKDGALWFTELSGNRIGRISTGGTITEYNVPTSAAYPYGITAGSDGALWFTEYGANKIGRCTAIGVITEYVVPVNDSQPNWIASRATGEVWFAEGAGNRIGEVIIQTATLGVTPSSGVYQTPLTFAGSQYTANETVEIFFSGVGSTVLATATADSTGSFSVPVHAPQSPFGLRYFLGQGQTSGKIGAGAFTVGARIVLNPNVGRVGGSSTASGYGFGPQERVKVYWNNPSTLLGTVTADINGTFTAAQALSFIIPAGAPTGRDTVTGTGQQTSAQATATFTVQ